MRSEPVAHATILLACAEKTITEARDAWRRARASPDLDSLRSALRLCILAARFSHRAAEAWAQEPTRANRLTVDAKNLEAAVADIKLRLAAVYAHAS